MSQLELGVWGELVDQREDFAIQESSKIYNQLTARGMKARQEAKVLGDNGFKSASLRRQMRACVYAMAAEQVKAACEAAGGYVVEYPED